MELLYLYLDNYRLFKKKGFCFSSEFEISVKVEVDQILNLRIKKNENYISNFFEDPNILNVTAVIGQNGTGKSLLLEFIRTAFPDGMGGFDRECIVVLKDQKSGRHLVYVTPALTTTINDETNLFQLNVLEKPEDNEYLTSHYIIESLLDTIFINYSNIVDLKIPSTITNMKIESEDESASSTGYRNISTMAMLGKDQQDFTNDISGKVEKVDAYKSREFGRNIEFLSGNHRNILDFELPEFLYLTLMDEDEKALKRSAKTFEWLFELIGKYEKEFIQKKRDKKPLFFLHFLRSTLFNLIRTDLTASSLSFSPEYIRKSKGKTFEEFFRNVLKNMKEAKFEGHPSSSLSEKSDKLLTLVDFVYEYLIKTSDPRIMIDADKFLALPVRFTGKFSIQDFIDHYVKAKSITDFLQFKWRSLSSGEQSMLTIVSRFFRLSQELNRDELKQDLIILLDEPDIYFHPEWQRTLLSKLLKYIPQILPNRRIQFIITANTPYLVSDLPPSNVILLRIKDKVLHVNSASTIHHPTFASNIHTLLSEDFYVTNFLGEFAKAKIEKLIHFMDKPADVPEYNSEKALKVIRMIGEPIIRNRLLDIYADKIGFPESSLLEQKQRLEKELNDLNRLIDEEGDNA